MAHMLTLTESATYQRAKAIGSFMMTRSNDKTGFLRRFYQFSSLIYPLKMTADESRTSRSHFSFIFGKCSFFDKTLWDFLHSLTCFQKVRSCHWRCSGEKKVVLKTFANFTGKHLCWSLFLITLQAFRRFILCNTSCDEDKSSVPLNVWERMSLERL